MWSKVSVEEQIKELRKDWTKNGMKGEPRLVLYTVNFAAIASFNIRID